MAELRVCALYPDLMNIYADRGNLQLLQRRCEWRGLGFSLAGAGLGDPLDPDAHDLFYIGGGQDRDQALCAEDLATVKRDALHAAAARGAVIFAVCGGYQLLGHGYELGGERLPGVGLVDLETVREDGPRLIGNVAIEVELDGDQARARRLREPRRADEAGRRARRSAACCKGHGNDGRSGFEGVRGGAHGTVLGTYLHGPLLPKNAWFADWLTATALRTGRSGAAGRRAGGRRARRRPASGRRLSRYHPALLPRGLLLTSTESAQSTGPSAYREAVELEFAAATKRYPGADSAGRRRRCR